MIGNSNPTSKPSPDLRSEAVQVHVRPPFDSTGGVPAEYEGGSGLISKVVTKSGSDEFHGSINYYLQNDSLVADDATGPDPSGAQSPRRARRPRSLRARALSYLARREHSRLELRRKLAPHAESPEQLESVLDTLEAQGLLSIERFADRA